MASGDSTKPRIGIPWRTEAEETAGVRGKLDYYFVAVSKAGGEPEGISLHQTARRLAQQVQSFDGFVLPGSPANVDPAEYGATKHMKVNASDPARDRTDRQVLDHALAAGKPVLAICYGCQLLNVHLRGTLVQDIRSEMPGAIAHGVTDLPDAANRTELEHEAKFLENSRLGTLAQSRRARINSSHHQAIDQPGKNLRVTATSSEDGIVEGVEWTGDGNWVVGVQWHPERMVGDTFSERLFADFVDAVRQRATSGATTK
jgi:putative glutamine amidotransferase